MANRASSPCPWWLVLLAELTLSFMESVQSEPLATEDIILRITSKAPAPSSMPLYLEVFLNGARMGLLPFDLREGRLYATKANLGKIGFNLNNRQKSQSGSLSLQDLEGVQYVYDERNQRITFTAVLDRLNLSTTMLSSPQPKASSTSTEPGMLLNYSLHAGRQKNSTYSLGGFAEMRAFSTAGLLSNSGLIQRYHGELAPLDNRQTRLDSTWSYSMPDDMRTVRLGDMLTASQSWSRPTRIAGIQWGRNFTLQPYRINTPLAAFIGSATLPSEVELYINGLRQYSAKVPAGPFQLTSPPMINGSGTAQLVVTDALGHATTLDFGLYNDQKLLQRGVSDGSAELGFVRENYGLSSFDYDHKPVASGTWRYGASDRLTAEMQAQGSNELGNAGIGVVSLLGERGGVLSGSLAHSRHASHNGYQYSAGYSWNNPRYNAGADVSHTQGDYADIASFYDAPIPNLSARALAGYNTPLLGHVGASYLHLHYGRRPPNRFASLYWSNTLNIALSLNLSLNQNLDESKDRSLALGFTLNWDRTSFSSGLRRYNGIAQLSLDASQALPSQGGWGWRSSLLDGAGQRGTQAQLDYLGPYGQVDVGVSALNDDFYSYTDARGGLVFMDRHVFASRSIEDGFAVVSTDGVPGVPIKLENNVVGKTDSQGRLLLQPLRAYQNNKVEIDPRSLPVNLRIKQVQALATPTDRAGTLVRFAIDPIRAAVVILIDPQGQPLPLGSQVHLRGEVSDEAAIVGLDGAAYLETLKPNNTFEVFTPNGVCQVSFDFVATDDSIPHLGPFTCLEITAT